MSIWSVGRQFIANYYSDNTRVQHQYPTAETMTSDRDHWVEHLPDLFIGFTQLPSFCLIPALFAVHQKQTPKSYPLDIRPADSGWGEAQLENVHRVLVAAANELWKYFPNHKLNPVVVYANQTFTPRTYIALGPQGEYQVNINVSDRYWAKYTYQFAHEFCHVLSKKNNGEDYPDYWFEETLCELASFFVLHHSAMTWVTNPPYQEWRGYAPSLWKYAEDEIKNGNLPENESLPIWFQRNEKLLRENPKDRPKNLIAAVQLLPLFEGNPEHWEAITWLNTATLPPHHSFADYLSAWRRNSPERHRAFITQIAKDFGIQLK